MRTASLSLLTILCLMIAAAPAMADQILYDNGPINGTTNAWTINSGFAVSDSFTLNDFFTYYWFVNDLYFGVWLVQGDTVTSVQMDIGTSPFGTNVLSVVRNPTGSTDLGINQYGYDIQQIELPLFGEEMLPGTYWLTLSNGTTPNGDPIYWDENSGIGCQSYGCPSSAYQTDTGSIPSEAFTISGYGQYFTPEPSSIMLFGSGILGLAGVLRRKLNI